MDAFLNLTVLNIFRDNKVNTMAADALTHCVVRSSAIMLMGARGGCAGKWIFVFHEGFQLYVPS